MVWSSFIVRFFFPSMFPLSSDPKAISVTGPQVAATNSGNFATWRRSPSTLSANHRPARADSALGDRNTSQPESCLSASR